jgi:hypothetical protein
MSVVGARLRQVDAVRRLVTILSDNPSYDEVISNPSYTGLQLLKPCATCTACRARAKLGQLTPSPTT